MRTMRGTSGEFPIDQLNKQISTQKSVIQENMDKINHVESTMDKARATAAEGMEKLEAESRELKSQIERLDKELDV